MFDWLLFSDIVNMIYISVNFKEKGICELVAEIPKLRFHVLAVFVFAEIRRLLL